MVSYYGFDLHYPMTNDGRHLFMHLGILFREMSIQVLSPFLIQVIFVVFRSSTYCGY